LSRTFVVLCAVIASAALVACTSSSKPKQTPLGSTSAPSTLTTPATTPTPSPTKTVPLSPFEDDPAVKALRTWADQAAKAFNAGSKFHDPALTALETKSFVPLTANIFRSDKGLRYPGPPPFTPISVKSPASAERDVRACFVAYGFAVDPRTGKAPKKLQLVPQLAQMVNQDGVWQVNHLLSARDFSCASVKVAMPKW